jgi:RNA-binding protein
LGIVLNVTPSQNIIIKSDKPQKIGVDVIDERLKVVGKTFDIIGPTSSPYIVVKPKIVDPKRLVGEKLYMILSRKKRRER